MSNNYVMDSQMLSLDRELELLKRKREMIQHQWEIIEQEKNLTLMMDSSRNQNNRPRNQNNTPRYQNNFERNQQSAPRKQFNSPRNQHNSPRAQQISPWSQDDFSAPMQYEQTSDNSHKYKVRGRKRRVEHTDWKSDRPSDRFNKKPFKPNASIETKSRDRHRQDDFVLRTTKEPSVQVQGRLELGLGSILKELRLSKSQLSRDIFNKHEYLKALKAVLRERIHSSMLGKAVTSLQVVVDNYRKVYPKHSDKDLLAEIKRNTELPESIEKYTKVIDKKIAVRIDALFTKLKEIDDEMENVKIKAQKIEIKVEREDNETPADDKEKPVKEAAGGDSGDAQENGSNVQDVKEPEGEVKENEDQVNNEKKPEQSEVNSNDQEKKDANSTETEESAKEVQGEKAGKEATGKDTDKTQNFVLSRQQEEAIDKIVNKHLWKILPLHKKSIIKFILNDADFMESIGRTKLPEKVKDCGLLFVRIMGKPSLPKKEEMQTFLDKFNPVVVKKHKFVHNLLFVGVKEMSEFEALVAADETVIAKMTLSVKVTNKTKEGLDAKKPAEKAETPKKTEDDEKTPVNANGESGEVDKAKQEDTVLDETKQDDTVLDETKQDDTVLDEAIQAQKDDDTSTTEIDAVKEAELLEETAETAE